MNIFSLCFIALAIFPMVCNATPAQDIIRRADEIRSPNQPFRYTVTVREYKKRPLRRSIHRFSMCRCAL